MDSLREPAQTELWIDAAPRGVRTWIFWWWWSPSRNSVFPNECSPEVEWHQYSPTLWTAIVVARYGRYIRREYLRVEGREIGSNRVRICVSPARPGAERLRKALVRDLFRAWGVPVSTTAASGVVVAAETTSTTTGRRQRPPRRSGRTPIRLPYDTAQQVWWELADDSAPRKPNQHDFCDRLTSLGYPMSPRTLRDRIGAWRQEGRTWEPPRPSGIGG